MARKEWLSNEWFLVNYPHLCRTYQTELSDIDENTKISISANAGTKYYLVNPLVTTSACSDTFVTEYMNPIYGTMSIAGWRMSFDPEIQSIPAGNWTVNGNITVEGGIPNNTLYLKCRLYKSSEPTPREAQCTLLGEAQTEIVGSGGIQVVIATEDIELNNEFLFLVSNIVSVDAGATDSLIFNCNTNDVYVEFPVGVPEPQITEAEVSVVIAPTFGHTPVEMTSVEVTTAPNVESSDKAGKTTSGETSVTIVADFSQHIVSITDIEISAIPSVLYGDMSAIVEDISVSGIPSVEFGHYAIAFTDVYVNCLPSLTLNQILGQYNNYEVTATPTPSFEEWSLPIIKTDGARVDNRKVDKGGFYKRR